MQLMIIIMFIFIQNQKVNGVYLKLNNGIKTF